MAYKADSIFKNQFFNLSMQVLNLLFPILAIPYTTRLFGPEILGEVNFANSIVQYFILIATAGIPVYATREIAKVRDNSDLLRKKFKEITILQVIFTIISLAIYIALIFFVDRFKSYIYVYLFLGLQIISYSFNFVWFLQGIEKYRYAAIATFISKLINIIMIFGLLRKREDFYTYAFIIGITMFINAFINMIFSFNLLKEFKEDNKLEINYKSVKMHVYSILVFFLSDIAVKVYTAMDQTMLGLLDSSESVAYYSMSIKLEKVVITLITSMAVVMLPRISNSIKHNKTEDVKKYVGMSINIVYLIAIPAIFGVLAIAEEIIPIFLGEEFLQSTDVFMAVSSLFVIIGLSNVFGVQVMIPYGREKKFTIILSVAAVINFIVNLILIPKFSYYGATFATILAEAIVTVWMYFEVKKIIGNIPAVFNLGRILVPSLMFYLVIKFGVKSLITAIVTVWMYFEVKKIIGNIPAVFNLGRILVPSLMFYLVIKFGVKSLITSDVLVILVSIPVAVAIYGLGLVLMKEPMVMSGIDMIKDKIKSRKKVGELN